MTDSGSALPGNSNPEPAPRQVRPWLMPIPGSLSSLCLGLSIGLQLLCGGLMILGPDLKTQPPDDLTVQGRTWFRPEHDLAVYLGGIALSLVLMTVTFLLWRRFLTRCPQPRQKQFLTASDLVQSVAAGGSLAWFLALLFVRLPLTGPQMRQPTNAADLNLIFIPTLLAIVCPFLDMRRYVQEDNRQTNPPALSRWRYGGIDLAVGAMLVMIVYIPRASWALLAGDFFVRDWCHHWNYFAMGPALAYRHGAALATDVYTQYGLAWPALLGSLSSLIPLSYANAIGLGIIVGCVYCLGTYLLLRTLLHSPVWAGMGAMLTVSWQLFSGLPHGFVIWLWPSSTMLRSPLDVWFFLALVLYERKPSLAKLTTIGAIVGAAIFCELDTGLYLLVTAGIYALLRAVAVQPWSRSRFFTATLAFAAGLVGVLLPAIAWASRGTFITSAFWSGWSEGIRGHGLSGMTLLPIAAVPDDGVRFLLIMLAAYLLAVAVGILKTLSGTASALDRLSTCLGAYGFAMLLIFVSRSHPFNLYHASAPFALLVTVSMARLREHVRPILAWTSIPAAVALALVILLVGQTDFQNYPSLLRSCFVSQPTDRLALVESPVRDLAGLPDDAEDYARQVHAVLPALRACAADGSSVLILDPNDTVLYCAADLPPWARQTSLLHSLGAKSHLAQLMQQISTRRPRYVVIPSPGKTAVRAEFVEVLSALYGYLCTDYRTDREVGGFTICERRADAQGRRQ